MESIANMIICQLQMKAESRHQHRPPDVDYDDEDQLSSVLFAFLQIQVVFLNSTNFSTQYILTISAIWFHPFCNIIYACVQNSKHASLTTGKNLQKNYFLCSNSFWIKLIAFVLGLQPVDKTGHQERTCDAHHIL